MHFLNRLCYQRKNNGCHQTKIALRMDKLDDDVSYSLRRGKDFLLKLLFFIFDVPLISQEDKSPEMSTIIC